MKWTKVLGWMALLFCAVFAVIYFTVSETRANDPENNQRYSQPQSENVINIVKEGYHYITPKEADQLKENYRKHKEAGTLKESPEKEIFNGVEITALTSLAGKDFTLYKWAAHEDGTPCTIIQYAGLDMQKGTPCPPCKEDNLTFK